MNYSLFIARKLLKQKQGRLSGPVVKVATAAVALGMAVMIISLSVGLGFKQQVRDKVVGFGTHIQIVSFDYNKSYETNPIQNEDKLKERVGSIAGVQNIQPFIVKPGIIKTDDAIQGIALKGVDESYDWTFINGAIEEGTPINQSGLTCDADSAGNIATGIVMSRKLVSLLKLSLGDPVRMYFIQGSNIKARKFVLRAIFNSHFPEYDDRMAFVDIRQLAKLNGWQPSQISGYEVIIDDFDHIDKVTNEIGFVTSSYVSMDDSFLRVQSIKQLQPQIFGWLNLLDMNIAVILALILAVASLNMVSGLLILILENTNTIGILKSMGCRNAKVQEVFVYMAVYIVGKGMLIGNVVGLLLCLVQSVFHVVTLDPENYYLDTVPVMISPYVIVILNLGTLLFATVVLLFPSFVISRIMPAKSIRFN